MERKSPSARRPGPARQEHSKPRPPETLSIGACTLAAGEFIHVHERTYIVLGMD